MVQRFLLCQPQYFDVSYVKIRLFNAGATLPLRGR